MSNPEAKPKSLMSDMERVRDFQRKIYQKAKQEKTYRFYVLYDKVSLRHFLREAYKHCKANNGKPGADGITFADIERDGVENFLEEIKKSLEGETYKPQPVLRVEILKANGKTRPLGIPVIRDRVVQAAVKLVIEPIFEADFEDTSYGFRPERSTKDAETQIKKNLTDGLAEVYDADLSAYFDTIPHDKLMILLEKRISDIRILRLIKMWLKAPVVKGNRIIGGKKNKIGTPQGGVISPLLANIYLHLLDKAVNRKDGVFSEFGVKIVRFADDFILMGKRMPSEVLDYLHNMLERMELKINKEKSRLVNAYKESFDFLGFTHRYSNDLFGAQKKYWNIEPSMKAQKNIRKNIKDYLKKEGHLAPEIIVADLNRKIRGWINNFTIEKVSYPAKAKRNLRYYLNKKLARFYKRKSQRKCKLYNRGAFDVLVNEYGLVDPASYVPKWRTVKA